jgi:bacterioferritin
MQCRPPALTFRKGFSHEGRPQGHRLSQPGAHQRADRDQPVLAALPRARQLGQRILFLEALPNFQAIHKLKVGETVEEVLRADLALEHEAIPLLKDAAEYARSVKDHTSAGLFEDILKNEEEHVDFLETQFEMIERMGLHNYCQLQSAPAGDS